MLKHFRRSKPGLLLGLAVLALLSGCLTQNARFVWLDATYPQRDGDHRIEVYRENDTLHMPYVEVAEITVNIEGSHRMLSNFEAALPSLKEQARLAGCDAIMNIRETTRHFGNSQTYEVKAVGIRYVALEDLPQIEGFDY